MVVLVVTILQKYSLVDFIGCEISTEQDNVDTMLDTELMMSAYKYLDWIFKIRYLLMAPCYFPRAAGFGQRIPAAMDCNGTLLPLTTVRFRAIYLGALANELPIGSGEIESAHRYIVQRRLKLPRSW